MSARPNYTELAQAQEPFNRPPRIKATLPEKTITIPPLPTKEEPPQLPNIFILIMPIIMIAAILIVYIAFNQMSMTQMVFILPMAIISIMSTIGNLLTSMQNRKRARQKNLLNVERYTKILALIKEELQHLSDLQREIAITTDPPPSLLEALISERSHLWERRPGDSDFLSVRVGPGKRPLAIKLTVPEMDPLHQLYPQARQLIDEFCEVTDIPCTVSLTKVKSLGLTGIRQEVVALARAMLCQIATKHAPEDVRIIGIYPASQQQDWEWLRELPHTAPLKGHALTGLTAIGEDEAHQLLNVLLEELSQRASRQSEAATAQNNTGPPPPVLPHIVVIVHNYVNVHKHPALTQAFKLGEQLGVSIIYMVAREQDIPGACRGIIRLFNDGRLNYVTTETIGENLEGVKADTIDHALAKRIAHSLSHVQLKSADNDDNDLPTDVNLLDLIGLPYSDQFKADQWWTQPTNLHLTGGMLRVPIGMGINGPVWLDLHDHIHGPHGIIAGTTGAGKSELLQSLIMGLAMTHHPHLVNFVLVDFKGGAAFKPFEDLPHTVGIVSDLSGKLTERALIALKSELRRREHILGSANATKIAEYLFMRAQSPSPMKPLPHLFIIIDEFAELAKEHPTFMEGLVSVVQKGRSLGVHLILATQKPTGTVSASIWSNLKFRICLRVASTEDSRDMLGRSEAAFLPSSIPGRAYFQIGSEVFELFQSARISKSARALYNVPIKQGSKEATDQDLLVSIMKQHKAEFAADLFRPWPDPLPHHITLEDINASLPINIDAEAHKPVYGWVCCPIGMIDLPVEQKQEPWLLDMPHSGGHLLIAGASGSGKSTFLRTLIVSLAQTHTPSQLHLYLIDYGGQALRVFEKMPHVGGVFSETDEEYIRRLLRQLQGIIEERKYFCTTHQFDDFLTYQRRSSEKSNLPELPAVVLVIDKFNEFRQVYDKDLELFLNIARHGRTYGVYLVLSADRPVSIPLQLMSLIEMRIGLRLVEDTDSLVLLGKGDACRIEATLPGRGYKRGKTLDEVHIALPVKGEDDDERAQHLEDFVTALQAHDTTPMSLRPPAIRLLPEYVSTDGFLTDIISSTQAMQSHEYNQTQEDAASITLHIGLEDISLRPVALELNDDTPHALVVGGPGSGRTGVLHTCLFMLAHPRYRFSKVILIDFRRSSRLLRRFPYIWMYTDTEARLTSTMELLIAELRTRQVLFREQLENMPPDSDELPNPGFAPLILVIDDYEQMSTLTRNPLLDLKEFLLQARDLHLHIILAGTPNDINRSDIVLQQVRSCRTGIILGADPADLPVLGVRMSDMPPGRGRLVRRNQNNLIQVAHTAPEKVSFWITELTSGMSDLEPRKAAPPVSQPQEKLQPTLD